MTDALTRQELLRRAAAGGAFLSVPGILAACGGSSTKSASSTSNHTLAKTLHFSNWPLYIDTNNKTHSHPSLQMFTKKFGVHVQYIEDINDNASFFGKIQGPLSRGQSIHRDLVVLTDNDRYLGLMIRKGWAEKLDKSAIPNIKNLIPVQQHPGFDPHREYSLPWQSGMTGIGYNAYQMRTSGAAWFDSGLDIKKTGTTYGLASTQASNTMQNRDLIRATTLVRHAKSWKSFVRESSRSTPRPSSGASFSAAISC